jgi:hypothetical protein
MSKECLGFSFGACGILDRRELLSHLHGYLFQSTFEVA